MYRNITTLALAVLMFGCGGSESSGGATTLIGAQEASLGAATMIGSQEAATLVSSQEASAAWLQGSWVGKCSLDPYDWTGSVRTKIELNNGQYTQSTINYINSLDCSSASWLSAIVTGTFFLDKESDQQSYNGAVSPIDIRFSYAMAEASEAAVNDYQELGTTFEEVMSARGIADVYNIALSDLNISEHLYSVYSVIDNTLSVGAVKVSGQGASSETRITELNAEFVRTNQSF